MNEQTITIEGRSVNVVWRDGAWVIDDPRMGMKRWLLGLGVTDEDGRLAEPAQYELSADGPAE